MANPAEQIRAKAQEQWEGATVVQRGRNSIKHQHPTQPGRYMLDSVIGQLHIANTETEIDTAWLPDTGAWQWQMVLADYHAHARNVFNAGDLVEYRHPASGEWVIFDPQSINWVNQDNSRQQIAIKQTVNAVVDDDILRFPAGYGTGRHFQYQCQTGRLQKLITIDSLSNLPSPSVTGTIWFESEFVIKNSTGIELYIDGARWQRGTTRIQTANRIEFKQSDEAEPLWWLDFPRAFDSAGNETIGTFEVRRQGANHFITVRVPKTWIDTAVYPVYIDPTIDPTVGADADDGKTAPSSDWSNDGNVWAGNYYGAWNAWHRFTGISGLAGKTIDVSYITTNGGGKLGSPDVRIYAERAASPAAPTSVGDYNGRTPTTAYTSWGGSDALSPTPSLNSPLQELVDNYDPTAIQIFHKNNGSASNENYYSFGNYGFGVTITLHIEYSDGVPAVTLEQEGFRFRNDDGGETTATWKADQDTSISIGTSEPFRLRTLINATGDPVSISPQVEYRRGAYILFSDDFTDNSFDTDLWEKRYGRAAFHDAAVTVIEDNSYIEVTPLSSTTEVHANGAIGLTNVDFTNCNCKIEILQAINNVGGVWAHPLTLWLDDNNEFSFALDGDAGGVRLTFQLYVNESYDETDVAFNSTTMKWVRLRHDTSDNTIKWETSPDASDWTVRRSASNPFNITSMELQPVSAGTYVSVASPGTFRARNFSYGANATNWTKI